MKSVRELFGHAVQRCSTIEDLMVEEVKFSKKQNAAIISLVVDRKINPVDIFDLEDRAVQIFTLKSFKVMPKLTKKNIDIEEKDIHNVISFISKKEEYIIPMLKGSKLNLNADNLTIELTSAQSKFLILKKIDKKIENVVTTLYGKNINVNIVDSKEAKEKLEKEMKEKVREVKIEYTKPKNIEENVEEHTKKEEKVEPEVLPEPPPLPELDV